MATNWSLFNSLLRSFRQHADGYPTSPKGLTLLIDLPAPALSACRFYEWEFKNQFSPPPRPAEYSRAVKEPIPVSNYEHQRRDL